jgi:formate hydrogenlyase transcriptional activator
MDALCRYHWPGNVRELQNIIERAVIISKGPALSIDVSDLKFPKADPRAGNSASPKLTGDALHNVLEETERQQILVALKQCNWIVAGPKGAAARLGVKRSTLQLRMHKLGIVRGSA